MAKAKAIGYKCAAVPTRSATLLCTATDRRVAWRRSVQISAVGPILPEKIKSICDANGLAIVITHEPGPDILGDPPKVIARLKAMGCKNTAFSGSGKDAAEYAAMAADIAKVAPIYAAEGIQVSYHNHAHEFQDFGGKTGMDIRPS